MSTSTKVLITGAAGLLGQAIVRELSDKFEIIAVINKTSLNNVPEKIIQHQADLTDKSQVSHMTLKYSPDVIINSAAWVDVDGCESDRDRALRSNYTVVENIVKCCQKQDIYLVQIPTDYIFNGVDHPAKPDDPASPLNYYGETKLMAENLLKEKYSNYLIARTCALIGTPNQGQTNLLNYFFDSLEAGKTISATDDQYSNPIWVDHVAELIFEAVNKRLKGTIHLGGADYMSRYDFALIFADVFGFDRNLIKPVSAYPQKRPAKRPQFAGLDIQPTKVLFDTKFQSIRDALKMIMSEVK